MLSCLLELILKVSSREKVCLNNLRTAFPDLSDKALRDVYAESVRFFSVVLGEIISGRVYRREWLEDMVDVQDFDGFYKALADGCLLLSAHFSNFEILPQLSYLSSREVYFLAKPLKPPILNAMFVKLREMNGGRFTPNLRVVLNYLKQGGVVGFLFDQHSANKKANAYKFFGRLATFNPLVYILAKTSQPIFLYLVKKSKYYLRWKLIDEEDIQTEISLATALNSHLETIIRQNPEQYFWFHRRWKNVFQILE